MFFDTIKINQTVEGVVRAGPVLRGSQGGLAPPIDMLAPQLTSFLF